MELTLIDILLGILKIFSFVMPVLISVALFGLLGKKSSWCCTTQKRS